MDNTYVNKTMTECYCIDCGYNFHSTNARLRRCDKCEADKYGLDPVESLYADMGLTTEEDNSTLEEALQEAEMELARANERIDLLLEILASMGSLRPQYMKDPLQQDFWPTPPYNVT